MRKPKICGRNMVNMPESGCGDCGEILYDVEQLQNWVEGAYLTTADIVALTPLECYEPPCADSRVCYGEVCCMKVACN